MSIQSLGEHVLIPYRSYTGPLKKALTVSHGQGIVSPYLAASTLSGGDDDDDDEEEDFVLSLFDPLVEDEDEAEAEFDG